MDFFHSKNKIKKIKEAKQSSPGQSDFKNIQFIESPKTSALKKKNKKLKNDERSVKQSLHQEKNEEQSSPGRSKSEKIPFTESHQNSSFKENKNKLKNNERSVKPSLHQEKNERRSPSFKNIDDNTECSDLHPNSSFESISICIPKNSEISSKEILHQENEQLEFELELFDTNKNTEQDIILPKANELVTEVSEFRVLLSIMGITQYNTLMRRNYVNISDINISDSNFENNINVQKDVKTDSNEFHLMEPNARLPENGNLTHHRVIVDENMCDSEIISPTNDLDEETSGSSCRKSITLSSSSSENNICDENILNNNYENAEIQYKTEESICDDTQSMNSYTECVCETDITWTPCGFSNPIGYCYLNSVVQSLVSCDEFRIALASYEPSTDNYNEDIIFVTGLCNLIRGLSRKNENEVNGALSTIQSHCNESAFGDDIFKCFMNILSRISNVIGNNKQLFPTEMSNLENHDEAEINFRKSRNKNQGFVFDNFYGQLVFQIVCKLCNCICNESFQLMKSLSLPIPSMGSTNQAVTMNMCLDLFFKGSEIDTDDPMPCACDRGCTDKLELVTKISHAPKYLFIYLNRGSYYDSGMKDETFVSCEFQIFLKTTRERILYNLVSVIDHVGNNEYGHYYCKCCYDGETWWCLNDSNVKQLHNRKDVVNQDSIGFVFKKHK